MGVRSTCVVANGMNAITVYADMILAEKERVAQSFRNIEQWSEALAKAASNAAHELEENQWSKT